MAAKRKRQSFCEQNSGNGVRTGEKNKNKKNTARNPQEIFMNEFDYRFKLQEAMYSSDYIIQNIFRKDGPVLGSEFDSLPDNAFRFCKPGTKKPHRDCQKYQVALKRQKVCTTSTDYGPFCEERSAVETHCFSEGLTTDSSVLLGKHGIGKGLMTDGGASLKKHGIGKGLLTDSGASLKKHGIGKGLLTDSGASLKKHGIGKGLMTDNGASLKKHGIGKALMTKKKSPLPKKHGVGKGLMTLWQVMKPEGRYPHDGTSSSKRFAIQERRRSSQRRQMLLRKSLQEKKKLPPVQCWKKTCNTVGSELLQIRKQPFKGKCKLALEGCSSRENLDQFATLMDDEELELRELQAGPNPLTCSAHFADNGSHGCSLCKDLLAKFPPDSVSMKSPLYSQPWDSSPELVKKLFKVFHFISTYATVIDFFSFSFDDFAQAFEDQESFVLGQVHVALLKVLLSDVEMELRNEYFAHKNSKFVELLHSVDQTNCVLGLWKKALNAMTWTEILRQVLVAAGYGSKLGTSSREASKKEESFMAKYGLTAGTLKGELFNSLLTQGSKGMKVMELANIPSITDLNLAATTPELEQLISSTLSSDITLFEKISLSGYRLRVNPTIKEQGNSPSDSGNFGSVDDDFDISGVHSSAEDSECEIRSSSSYKLRRKKNHSSRNKITACTEIDESHPGEAWLLGLMDGEYSDLSIEEKLSAMLALIDLLSSGSSCRIEDPVSAVNTVAPKISHGSGAKIKRSTGPQNYFPSQVRGYGGLIPYNRDAETTSVHNPVDSWIPMLKISDGGNSSIRTINHTTMRSSDDLHPMQSIYLGSDRRYNRYWLFLGPCDGLDAGHKRIYFESSDDGHWEVIDNGEALCSLVAALDRRGTREAFLLSSLEKREMYLCQAMSNRATATGTGQPTPSDNSDQNLSREDSSSAVSDVDNNLSLVEMQSTLASSTVAVSERGKKSEQRDKWYRAQELDRWIWKSFYYGLKAVIYGKRSYHDSLTRCERCHDLYWRDEKHCKVCHMTFELGFDLEENYALHIATCRGNMNTDKFPKHKVLSSQLQALKAAISSIELVMPDDLMTGAWAKYTHNLWVKRLRRASTLTDFLQVVADFVNAINEKVLYQHADSPESSFVLEEIVSSFPSMPQTSSSIALWLVKLDELVAPHLERAHSLRDPGIVRRLEGRAASHR